MSVLSALSVSRRPATGFVIVGLFWGCFAAYVPVIKDQLGASDALFGLLLLGSGTGLVSAMWIAPMLDRRMGARSMQVAAGLLAFAWLWPGVITWPVLFFLVMLCVGLASGMLDVIMNARVSELEAVLGRSLMNASHGMFSLGYAVAALLTGLAREAGVPPVAVFAGFGVFALAMVPVLAMEPASIQEPEAGRGRFPIWPVLVCGAVVLVAFMSEASVEAWSALHIERTLGGGAAEGALGPAMLGLTMTLGRFSGQVVADRVREVTVVVIASVIAASGALIAAIATTPMMAYAGFGILGLGVSVIGPMGLALVGRLVPPHRRTDAIGRVAAIGFSGMFWAPSMMGFVSQWYGLRVAFGCVVVLLLSAIPLAAVMNRMDKAKSTATAN